MRRLVAAAAVTVAALGLPVPALAQQGDTVESLLNAGYEIKGAFPSSAGPGILLVRFRDPKAKEIVMCFVAETPGSEAITTQYCKPVH